MTYMRATLFGLVTGLLCCLGALAEPVAQTESALIAPKSVHALALDLVALPNGRVLAVGERGHILLSDDQGQSWRQVSVPSRSTLTALAAVEGAVVAVGHDSVILRSTDGGNSWQLIHSAPENEKPFLDVFFSDASHGFAIGAYGYFARSSDTGASWTEDVIASFEMSDFGFPHLYHMTRTHEGNLLVVGEAGFISKSVDQGLTWQRMSFPYEGTLFAVHETRAGSLLVAGMRGHLFRSVDAGVSWQAIETGVHSGLNDIVEERDGRIFISGMEGMLLYSDNDGASVAHKQRANRKGISSLIPQTSSKVLISAEDGVSLFDMNDDSVRGGKK